MLLNKQLLKVAEKGVEREEELLEKLEDQSIIVLKQKYEFTLNKICEME